MQPHRVNVRQPVQIHAVGSKPLFGRQSTVQVKTAFHSTGVDQVGPQPSRKNLVVDGVQPIQGHGRGPRIIFSAVRQEQIQMVSPFTDRGHHGHRSIWMHGHMLEMTERRPRRRTKRDEPLKPKWSA